MAGYHISDTLNVGHAWVCDGMRTYTDPYKEYTLYVVMKYWDDTIEFVEEASVVYNSVALAPTTYHMNWGWEGLSNGWFLINKLQPSSDMNLSYNISIIRNIMPAGSTNLEQNKVNTNDEIIYDILGRVVTEMTPGNMYIKGGKKFIAR
jgi:hypothetical protein